MAGGIAKIAVAVGGPVCAGLAVFTVETMTKDEEQEREQKTQELVDVIMTIDEAKEKVEQKKEEKIALDNQEDPDQIANQALVLLTGKGMQFSKQEDVSQDAIVTWRVSKFKDGYVVHIHPDMEKTKLQKVDDLNLFNHLSEGKALLNYYDDEEKMINDSYTPIKNLNYDDKNQLLSWESNQTNDNEAWNSIDKDTSIVLNHQHGDVVESYQVSRWYFSESHSFCHGGWDCEQGIKQSDDKKMVSLDFILSQQSSELNLDIDKNSGKNILKFGESYEKKNKHYNYSIFLCDDNEFDDNEFDDIELDDIQEDWEEFYYGYLDNPYLSIVIGESMLNVPLEDVTASFKYWVDGKDNDGNYLRDEPGQEFSLRELKKCPDDYKITLTFPKDQIRANTEINDKWFRKNGNLTHTGDKKADPIKDFSLTIVY
ncbi:MAG: hypothetical protein ACON5A_03655 [Candidatus Comchoanobacterales bacterium]